MKSTSCFCLILLIWILLFAANPIAPRASAETAATASTTRQMQEVLRSIDASKANTSWPEYVVVLYERLQGRPPTAQEFGLLCTFREEFNLKPSEALSVVLRGTQAYPSYEQIQAFLDAKTADTLAVDDAVRAAARQLALDSPRIIAQELEASPGEFPELALPAAPLAPDPPDLAYNIYFGYLHAHSNLSDGVGTALEAYSYARDEGKLDFFALTDHSELMIFWPWDNKWQQLKDAADQSDAPGSFAALYGFEWSHPYLGHFTVVNSNDFTSAFQDFRVPAFYQWLVQRPEAIGRFNHPGIYDFIGRAFLRFQLFPAAVPQMVGMELFNENLGFDYFYYNGSWGSDTNFWDLANQKGWQVGALGGEDNHRADWGTKCQFRTAVLAQELTRKAILDAYRHRRFYSTEDQDLLLDFRCAGYPMGAHVDAEPRTFQVTASDGGGDSFDEVRLYRNGTLIETQPVEGATVDVTFQDNATGDGDYYYVIVRQTDDNDANGRNDEAISSPIWLGAPLLPPMGCARVSPPNDHTAAASVQGDFFVTILFIGLLICARRGFSSHSNRQT